MNIKHCWQQTWPACLLLGLGLLLGGYLCWPTYDEWQSAQQQEMLLEQSITQSKQQIEQLPILQRQQAQQAAEWQAAFPFFPDIPLLERLQSSVSAYGLMVKTLQMLPAHTETWPPWQAVDMVLVGQYSDFSAWAAQRANWLGVTSVHSLLLRPSATNNVLEIQCQLRVYEPSPPRGALPSVLPIPALLPALAGIPDPFFLAPKKINLSHGWRWVGVIGRGSTQAALFSDGQQTQTVPLVADAEWADWRLLSVQGEHLWIQRTGEAAQRRALGEVLERIKE